MLPGSPAVTAYVVLYRMEFWLSPQGRDYNADYVCGQS